MIHGSFKKIFSLFILLLAGVLSMSSHQVTKEAALSKATQFFKQSDAISRRAARKAPQFTLANNRNEFYVFNDEANGGYIVVSGDERMPDVLGYSYTGHFDAENIPCNMNALLEGYAEQINLLRTNSAINRLLSYTTNSDWSSISPMLECTWGHRTPYNNLCPEVDGKHTASGCVAIAMAQIMFYHKWPQQTTNIIPSYTTETLGLVIPEIPVTTINWDIMLNYYDPYDENKYESYTKEQADAVATLMKLCNVAVKTDFGQDVSSAYMSDVTDAFLKYFDYNSTIDELCNDYGEYEIEEWNQIVYDELSNGRPVMCAEPGHAFVIDGYDKDGYFHMNFGEHDRVYQEDGYFLLSWVNNIITGVQPNYPDAPHAYAVFDDGKLSFYYDKEKGNRSGEIYTNLRSCASGNAGMAECEFAPSFANVRLRNLESFFKDCKNLKTINGIKYLNTSEVKTMQDMFYGCSSIESLDLSSFKTDKVTNMMNMFCGCSALTSLDVSSFNTKNVENMDGLFYGLESLKTLDVTNFNTTKVTDMSVMFQGCSSLKELDLTNFDTSNVKNMRWMFGRCFNLTSLDVSSFKTNNVMDMSGMFYCCSSLTSVAIPSSMTSIGECAFYNCSSLTSVTIGSGIESIGSEAFAYCSKLTDVYCYAVNVPNTNTDAFNYSSIKTATLHVPAESVDAYKAAEPWKNFKEIVGYIKGDVNGDGDVDIADAVCVVNYVVGKPNTTFIEAAADVNGDGDIDIADAVHIVNYVVGKISALAPGFGWTLPEPE